MEIDSFLDNDDLDLQIFKSSKHDDSISLSSLRTINKDNLNPVEENLLKQLHRAQEHLTQARNNIDIIQSTTEKILQNLSTKTAYQEEASSDSDSDLYTSTGDPIVKTKKYKRYEKLQVLQVHNIWQRIIDDKWIIGVLLKSTTTCLLKEPSIYVSPKVEIDNFHGVSAFWTLVDDAYWYPIEEIEAQEKLVATAVLDLPSFGTDPQVEINGMLSCEFGDKLFQTPLPNITLDVKNITDGCYAVNFSNKETAQFSILALKAISIDKLVLLPVQPDSSTGKRLMKFLDRYGFNEVNKICVMRNVGSLQYCLLEVLPTDEADVRVLISARSEAQLSTIVQLMREYFPELLDIEKQQTIDEAGEALCQELRLYLNCDDATKIQRARILTDMLIP